MDIRHLGAADALVDPAHHIAEDALAVVVDFLLHIVGRPVRLRHRDGEDVGQLGAGTALGQFLLARLHIDLVIMQRMQGRGGRRGHPCGGGAGLRMPIFCASMSAILSGAAHMPLPIWAWPGRPSIRPTSTFHSS